MIALKKRGIAVETLVQGIIVVVVFFALLSLASLFLNSSSEKAVIEKCRISTLANSKTHEYEGDAGAQLAVSTDIPISCPAPNKQVSGKYLTEQFYAISEELRNCWYKMGEGQLKIFGKDYIGDQSLLENTNTAYCLVCSQFTTSVDRLDKKLFGEFVLKQQMPGKLMTYAQYLRSATATGVSKDFFYEYDNAAKKFGSASGIKPKAEYLVVFTRVPKSYAGGVMQYLLADRGVSANQLAELQNIMIVPKADLANSGMCYKLFWERAG